jgi:YidC/Oxa1 family membrane protein insertase
MDQQRRLLMFVTLSLGVLILWTNVVMPLMFPRPPGAEIAPDELAAAFDFPADALHPDNVRPAPVAVPQPAGMPEHPARTVTLGSLDPESGYFLNVELTSRGAAIESVELNDERYPELGQRGTPVRLVGHDALAPEKTFATRFPQVDAQLGGKKTLEEVHWEVVPGSQTESSVQFRIVSPDGALELVKQFDLQKLPSDKPSENVDTRDRWADGYFVKLTVITRNLSAEPVEVKYDLRGPVGLPLEDPENTSKHRDVRMGFLQSDGTVESTKLTASEAVKQHNAEAVEIWKRPIQYLGIDTQYFTALVHPVQDQLKSPTIDTSQAEVIKEGPKPEFADVSVTLNSVPRTLAPRDDVAASSLTDEFVLFAGPKRPDLLKSLKAEPVLDYGMFGWLVVLMLWILDSLHAVGVNYGLAIVGLTCVVRACIFPLSRHQSRSMDKMKELQPKIKVLHEKYKKNPESLSREEMRTMQEVNLKMMWGCLPLFLQMPIFIALYHSINISVDLRMAPMHLFGHWIDNLAAPDNLFAFGFALPFLGWNAFNLLPVITIVLFVLNQKITMPPPVDEEQALQYKMMNVMMIVMGVFFWRVPAGLCVYFIVSSIWGMTERLLLKKFAPPKTEAKAEQALGTLVTPQGEAPITTSDVKGKPSLLDDLKGKIRELQEMADKPTAASRKEATITNKDRKGKKPR